MNKHDFINQTLSTLNIIEYNVSKTGFLMGDDALKLIKLCENTIDERETYIELKYKNNINEEV